MERFVVRKNTLPYIQQWAVLDVETGNKVGDYKTNQLAEEACNDFRQNGLPNDSHGTPPSFEDALNAASKRMVRPGGDPPPQTKNNPRHSNKRKVELD